MSFDVTGFFYQKNSWIS